jgi:hypothetical protein
VHLDDSSMWSIGYMCVLTHTVFLCVCVCVCVCLYSGILHVAWVPHHHLRDRVTLGCHTFVDLVDAADRECD